MGNIDTTNMHKSHLGSTTQNVENHWLRGRRVQQVKLRALQWKDLVLILALSLTSYMLLGRPLNTREPWLLLHL